VTEDDQQYTPSTDDLQLIAEDLSVKVVQ
jgi:hypothetical protein